MLKQILINWSDRMIIFSFFSRCSNFISFSFSFFRLTSTFSNIVDDISRLFCLIASLYIHWKSIYTKWVLVVSRQREGEKTPEVWTLMRGNDIIVCPYLWQSDHLREDVSRVDWVTMVMSVHFVNKYDMHPLVNDVFRRFLTTFLYKKSNMSKI